MVCFSRLSIHQKLVLALLVSGSVFATIVGLTAYVSTRQALIQQNLDAVEAVAITRSAQIEQWISGLHTNAIAYAENESVITALRAFQQALDTSQDTDINRDARMEHLRDTFKGDPALVDAENLTSPYRTIHKRFHPFFQHTQVIFGYSDILLVSPLGDVVYTANKNPDVYTNLVDGIYGNTALGNTLTEILEAPSPDSFAFVDFTNYPATNQPTAFAIRPVFAGGHFIGVVVFSIPLHSIEDILDPGAGIGESGQTYIVSREGLLRTEVKIPAWGGSPILNKNVILDNEAVNSALAGPTDAGFTDNYLGVSVLSAWRPVSLGPSATWILVVETPVSEAIAPANTIISAIAIGFVVGAVLIVFLSFVFANQIGSPLIALTRAAEKAACGDFRTRVDIQAGGEIGTLTNACNSMSEQLQDLFQNLEAKAVARTHELELVLKVSAEATTELRLGDLLPEVVQQTCQAFDLYHVSVFLVYPDQGRAVYTSGTGTVGQALLAEGLSLNTAKGKGIVPQAIRTKKPVLVNDISHSDLYKPSQQLPETLAELALPMIVRDRVVGILDLQSCERDRFTEDEQRILLSLAQQLAIAVEHARLYEEQIQVAEALQRLDGMKSEFLARMSHELRTPLNSIINFTKFVIRGDLGEINAHQTEALDKSVKSAEHLLSLINDLLDISKIEAGMLQLFIEDNVDIGELLEGAAAVAAVSLADKPVDLEVDVAENMPLVVGDRRRINQIILNLVSNACKFTETGTITIRAEVASDEALLTVTVVDTGPGIAENELAIIFEPFKQTKVGSANASGTGLGLPISKKLVEALHGTMIISSAIGKGSSFGFTIPIRSAILCQMLDKELGQVKE